MTTAQNAKYWAEWAKLRDVLRAQGKSHLECEEWRKALTRRALGAVKSSKDFTNTDLDRVLARMAAEREPDNFDAQMSLQDSPDRRRAAHKARAWDAMRSFLHLGSELKFQAAAERYCDATAKRMFGGRFEDLAEGERVQVVGALQRSARVKAARRTATVAGGNEAEDVPY